MMVEVLILSMADVERLLNMNDAIVAMEEVFAATKRKEADSIGVMHVDAHKHGGFWGIKPGYLVSKGYIGLKLGCGYEGNAAKGLPTAIATILLCDATNGLPLAVLDGTYVTGVRTGATGGVAAKYLARKDSKIVGVVGTGVQGRMQVLALRDLFRIEEIRAYDIDGARLSAYVKEMERKMKTKVSSAKSAEQAARGADILVTVTPSTKPYIMRDWITPGVHVNAFGADALGKCELEKSIYKEAKLVTDKIEVALEKKLFARKDIYAELGEVITGTKKGRVANSETTVFDSSGIGVQDIAAAALVYEKATKLGVGKQVRLS